MNISLAPLSTQDYTALYMFECHNRPFFETYAPSRGDDYYHYETFVRKNDALLKSQEAGRDYFYLIKNNTHDIVGRMNLTNVHSGSADIGYRIAEHHTGKEIAQQALKELIETAKIKDITRLHAQTTQSNIASQKVLMKLAFRHTHTGKEQDILNDKRDRFMYFERITAPEDTTLSD